MEPTGNNGLSPLDELQRQLNEDLAQVVAPTPPPLAAAGSGSAPLVATTISTIVLQGGPLQLVIALLKVSEGFIDLFNSNVPFESDYRINDQPTPPARPDVRLLIAPEISHGRGGRRWVPTLIAQMSRLCGDPLCDWPIVFRIEIKSKNLI